MALTYYDSKVHGANMGHIWGQQDPGGPHVGPTNLVIWVFSVGTLDVFVVKKALQVSSASITMDITVMTITLVKNNDKIVDNVYLFSSKYTNEKKKKKDNNMHMKCHRVTSVPLLCKTPAQQFLLPYHVVKSCRSIKQINLVSHLWHRNEPGTLQHIEAETKWLPISRRHFQMHFPE